MIVAWTGARVGSSRKATPTTIWAAPTTSMKTPNASPSSTKWAGATYRWISPATTASPPATRYNSVDSVLRPCALRALGNTLNAPIVLRSSWPVACRYDPPSASDRSACSDGLRDTSVLVIRGISRLFLSKAGSYLSGLVVVGLLGAPPPRTATSSCGLRAP